MCVSPQLYIETLDIGNNNVIYVRSILACVTLHVTSSLACMHARVG
jgi:hypothetical protein